MPQITEISLITEYNSENISIDKLTISEKITFSFLFFFIMWI